MHDMCANACAVIVSGFAQPVSGFPAVQELHFLLCLLGSCDTEPPVSSEYTLLFDKLEWHAFHHTSVPPSLHLPSPK